MSGFKLSGQVVDLLQRKIYPGEVEVSEGRISSVRRLLSAPPELICPMFVDAHGHPESSMLLPAEFARLAFVHGTGAFVSDPHEIGNVLGEAGIEYLIENGATRPFCFAWGAPSCVPATPFETAGAELGAEAVDRLLARPEVTHLSEVMAFPLAIAGEPSLLDKIEAAKRRGKPVDGHAPGLRGDGVRAYFGRGISTDHECFTLEEAEEKLACGVKIIIREGSAAKNFEALYPLIESAPEMTMFCTDDIHPNDLVAGHINALCARAIAKGIDPLKVFQTACLNPVRHYRLPLGLLQPGDRADLVRLESLASCKVLETYAAGQCVAKDGKPLLESIPWREINNWSASPISTTDLKISAAGGKVRSIQIVPGQLVSGERIVPAEIEDGYAVSCPIRDILKIVVVNRYRPAKPAIAFVSGFGLDRGAVASSVAHDSHNIVAVGASDEDLAAAINMLIDAGGGISAVAGSSRRMLALPIAGLISGGDGYKIAAEYLALDRMAKELGSKLPAPFMTLSFLALLVIPDLKLSDRGLFSILRGQGGEFVSVFTD
jgi:adenine deaminase